MYIVLIVRCAATFAHRALSDFRFARSARVGVGRRSGVALAWRGGRGVEAQCVGQRRVHGPCRQRRHWVGRQRQGERER